MEAENRPVNETRKRYTMRYLDGEDVTGNWLPNVFLLNEADPEWSFPFASAYVRKYSLSVLDNITEDLLRATCYVLSERCRGLLDAETKGSAENVLSAIMTLPCECDHRGNACVPQIKNINDNILYLAWELTKKLRLKNRSCDF